MRVDFDDTAIRAVLRGPEILRDVERRAEAVKKEAARRAATRSQRWADAMDTETSEDADGPHVDISWRHGTGAGEDWRGHFFEFGHDDIPGTPALRGALDAATRNL